MIDSYKVSIEREKLMPSVRNRWSYWLNCQLKCKFEFHITHTQIVIGQFKQREHKTRTLFLPPLTDFQVVVIIRIDSQLLCFNRPKYMYYRRYLN